MVRRERDGRGSIERERLVLSFPRGLVSQSVAVLSRDEWWDRHSATPFEYARDDDDDDDDGHRARVFFAPRDGGSPTRVDDDDDEEDRDSASRGSL